MYSTAELEKKKTSTIKYWYSESPSPSINPFLYLHVCHETRQLRMVRTNVYLNMYLCIYYA